MNKNKALIIAAMACMTLGAHAQQTAVKMVADGQYRGARQWLERYLDTAGETDKGVAEAEALALVCDYVLQSRGTADRIDEWVEENPASPYLVPLRNMERIQLLRENRLEEALTLFFIAERNGEDMTRDAVYPYPIGDLADEVYFYNMVLYRLAGEKFYDAGEYEQALSYLQKGEKTRSRDYKLGMSHYHLAHYADAAQCLTEAAGTEADALAQNAWLHAGLSWLKTGNKRSAQMSFQQASSITNGDARVREAALYNYAMTLRENGATGFDQSVTVMEQFLNDYPRSAYADKVSECLTDVYFTTKNYPAALASINKIQQPTDAIKNAKQRVLYNLGVQKFAESDFEQSLNYANQAIALDRDKQVSAESHFLKGESEYRCGDYAGATANLQRALGSDALQSRDYANYTLGYALFKQQRYAEALPVFQSFAGSDLAKERVQLAADALNRMGDCYLDKRNYEQAYECYSQSLDTYRPLGDYSLLQQAYIQGLRGNYDEKVALIDRMNAEYAESEYASDALFEQGRAFVLNGNYTAAADVFRGITERYPHSVNARKSGNELAMILAETGKTDAAIAAYRKMMADYPDTEEAHIAVTNLKDLYTAQGKVNEYVQLAQQLGKPVTADEMDNVVHEAAIKAMADGKFLLAKEHYARLKEQTVRDDMRREAQLGLMRSAVACSDIATAVSAASVVCDPASKFSAEVKAEALMTRADCLLKQGNTDAAVADLQRLAQDNVTVYGAQGTVRLAQYAYDTKQYESAEQVLLQFIDSGTSHNYWLARAFVLLSDVYKAQGRDIESQQTLLSLRSSYTESEEINKMIEERLK